MPPPTANIPTVIPASDCVYTEQIARGHKREYYDSVQCDVPTKLYDKDFDNVVPRKWKVSVGDLIAIRCRKSSPPKRKPLARKRIWYPFAKRWSPGQVIAIFQDTKAKGRKGGENMMMQVRWFYRRHDLEAVDDEGLFKEQLMGSDHQHDMVYETDTTDDFPIHSSALGKVVVTAFKHNALQGSYSDSHTGLPQMTFVCRYRVGDEDKFVKTVDWDAYHDWKPDLYLPAPIFRGLKCEDSYVHGNQEMENAFIGAVHKRWKAEYVRPTAENIVDVTGGTPRRLLQKVIPRQDPLELKTSFKQSLSAKKKSQKKKPAANEGGTNVVAHGSRKKRSSAAATQSSKKETEKQPGTKRKGAGTETDNTTTRPTKQAKRSNAKPMGESEAQPAQTKRATRQSLRKEEVVPQMTDEEVAVAKSTEPSKKPSSQAAPKGLKSKQNTKKSGEASEATPSTKNIDKYSAKAKTDAKKSDGTKTTKSKLKAAKAASDATQSTAKTTPKAKMISSGSAAETRNSENADQLDNSPVLRRTKRSVGKNSTKLPTKRIVNVEVVERRSSAEISLKHTKPTSPLAIQQAEEKDHTDRVQTVDTAAVAKEPANARGSNQKVSDDVPIGSKATRNDVQDSATPLEQAVTENDAEKAEATATKARKTKRRGAAKSRDAADKRKANDTLPKNQIHEDEHDNSEVKGDKKTGRAKGQSKAQRPRRKSSAKSGGPTADDDDQGKETATEFAQEPHVTDQQSPINSETERGRMPDSEPNISENRALSKKRKSPFPGADHKKKRGLKKARQYGRKSKSSSERPLVHFGTEFEVGDQVAPLDSELDNYKMTKSTPESTNADMRPRTVETEPKEVQTTYQDNGNPHSLDQNRDDPKSIPTEKHRQAQTPPVVPLADGERSTGNVGNLLCSKKFGTKRRNYYSSTVVESRIGDFASGALPSVPRKGGAWTLRAGDIVCVECAEACDQAEHILRSHKHRTPTEARKWFPFLIPWSYCQVLSIYCDVDMHNVAGEMMIELRWFYRKSELQLTEDKLKNLKIDSDDGAEGLVESNHVNFTDWAASSVLGRVDLFLGNHDHVYYPVDDVSPTRDDVPVVRCRCRYSGDRGKIPVRLWHPEDKPQIWYKHMIERGFEVSKHMWGSAKLKKATSALLLSKPKVVEPPIAPVEDDSHQVSARSLRSSPQNLPDSPTPSKSEEKALHDCEDTGLSFLEQTSEAEDDIDTHVGENSSRADERDSSKSNEERVGLRMKDMYFCDVASLRSYYREIHIIPPYERYASNLCHVGGTLERETDSPEDHWRVKMGDTVVVHWEDDRKRESKYPFNVPWGVCEVVTLWKEHETVEEAQDAKSALDTKILDTELQYPSNQESIMMEVRWLYRKDELPGSYPSSKTTRSVDNEHEEVLESDHCDDCDAASLLAPVKLHSRAVIEEKALPILGMPILEYYCRRFWSIHRKSLVPSGSLDAMSDRGRMYSSHLGRNQVLRAALNAGENEGTEDSANAVDSRPSSPSVAFREVIKKLSLIDASETTDVRGLKLIGREREQSRIISFLRSAIRGEAGVDGDYDTRKSSLFIAGPPGTGKTASVKSAVERLRHEQAKGDIPEFQFVYLNGMEMRHPFETYVKLWEAISDPRDNNCATKKDKRTPGAAAQLLERRFTKSSQTKGDARERHPVTVLLLDEIDYLVTRKQTVLYNLFDWPIRTATRLDGPRLVVVGISNTLNLPDRLKPSVRSRLGGERCDFACYKVDEMVRILKMKIAPDSLSEATPVFEDDAILFAARKTGALSGDLRKALQICKSAAETVLAELEDDEQDGTRRPVVGIRDVQKVSRRSFSSVLSKAVSLASPYEALLLVSLASLSRTSGRDQGGFDIKEVMTKMESVAAGSGDQQYMPPPTFEETLYMLNRLGEGRLVSLHTPKSSNTIFRAAQGGSGGAWALISLPMESSSVLTALRDSPHSGLADKFLGTARPW